MSDSSPPVGPAPTPPPSAAPRLLYALLALACALRAVALWQALDTPLLTHHRWGESDMRFFDDWAQAVAAGDWLSERVGHPHHGWHQITAHLTLMPRPHLIESAREHARARGMPEQDPGRALWDRWYGGPRLHQAPLYPYALAVSHRLGAGVLGMLVAQLLLGVWTLWLLYGVTARRAGPTAGLLAVGAAMLYAPLLAFELALLRASAITFAGLLLVDRIDRVAADPERRARGWLLLGLLGGLATLLKPTLALLPACAPWLAASGGRERLRATGLVALAAALTLTPLVARNLHCGAPPLSISSVGPVTFAAAWTAGFEPEEGWTPPLQALGEVMLAGDGKPWPTARAALATHPDASGPLALLLRKLLVTAGGREVPNNTNLAQSRRHAPLLRWLPLRFEWLLALALIAILGGALPRAATPLALVALALAPQLGLYSISRFRAPLAAALLPFAAAGLLTLIAALRARRWRLLAAALAASAPLLIYGGTQPQATPRVQDLEAELETFHRPRVNAALGQDEHSAAADELERLLDALRPLIPRGPAYRRFAAQVATRASALRMRADDYARAQALQADAQRWRASR